VGEEDFEKLTPGVKKRKSGPFRCGRLFFEKKNKTPVGGPLVATIAQRNLFGWKEIEALGDLERLRLVLESVPDEPLMRILEKERGKGRDDYPVRGVWNSILAGVVFQHSGIESLRRELQRNAQLRQLCGLDPLKGAEAVAPASVYSRFLKQLIRHERAVEAIFDRLVEELREALPNFGRTLGIDGKALWTHAKAHKGEAKAPDGRRDTDADWGAKSYRGRREDGTRWERVKRWFGYKLHLVVDAEYELPVAFEVTRASRGEQPLAKALVKRLEERHGELLEGCQSFLGDKGYDDTPLIVRLWDAHRIKPVIDIRNCWQESDDNAGTRVLPGTTNVTYDYEGNVFCSCPLTGERRAMAYGGFEASRETLKYRCPARHYGLVCRGRGGCPLAGAIRIKLETDRRIFTPVARSSYAWKALYKKRTAAERVNSRLDVSFGFENHFIRGRKKMKLRCGLALIVMLAMALGRVREKQKEHLRSLVRMAA